MEKETKESQNLECILVVEDNPGHAELIKESIKDYNVLNPVVWIDNGLEALDYVNRQGDYKDEKKHPRPCLVLLDLKLPGKDGKEILKEIKSNESTKSLPVVMLTSSDQGRDVDECYMLGANSYIAKPVSYGDFMTKVQAIPMYWLMMNEMPHK